MPPISVWYVFEQIRFPLIDRQVNLSLCFQQICKSNYTTDTLQSPFGYVNNQLSLKNVINDQIFLTVCFISICLSGKLSKGNHTQYWIDRNLYFIHIKRKQNGLLWLSTTFQQPDNLIKIMVSLRDRPEWILYHCQVSLSLWTQALLLSMTSLHCNASWPVSRW